MEPDLLIKISEYTKKLYEELINLGFIAEIDNVKALEDIVCSKIYLSKPEDDEEDGPYYSIEVECDQENVQFAVSGLFFTKWYYDDDQLVEEYDSEALSSLEGNTEVDPSEVAQRIFEHVQDR